MTKMETEEAAEAELEETPNEDPNKQSSAKPQAGGTEAHKSKRQRKRHYFNAIRAQMEFYFSDANLSKDRFLKKELDKDPYVLLELFLKFNKIKALTSSVDDIAKSLSNSLLLELSEDNTKVRRKTELVEERNVDQKTLYVEALPPTANHDWMREIFERFGKVVYVSLPKYPKSRKLKEFGFIEFEDESGVAKAVKEYSQFNGVLHMENPTGLKSIQTFIEPHKEEEMPEESKEKIPKVIQAQEIENVEPPKKKLKTDSEENESSSNSQSSFTGEDSNVESEEKPPATDQVVAKKKRRKKRRSSGKSAEKHKTLTEANVEASFYDLKILPKPEWKKLRNTYLNLQREKCAELKRKEYEERKKSVKESKMKPKILKAEKPSATPKQEQTPKRQNLKKMKLNFYGAGEDDSQSKITEKEVKINNALARPTLYTYQPGIIVAISFLEPMVTLKEFKAEMRQYPGVKYIDVKEGATSAYIRLDTPATAEEFVRRVGCAEYLCEVLTDDMEEAYWKKIEEDRKVKLSKRMNFPHKRGKEKIKKLIAKHIRYDDETEEPIVEVK